MSPATGMLISTNKKVKLKKVLLKDLYLDPSQGLDLKHSHTLAVVLFKNRGTYFPPLCCQKDIDGRFMVKEGHHRYVAYLANGYKDCWVVYAE